MHDAVSRLAPSMPGLEDAGVAGSWWNRDNSVEYDVVVPKLAGRQVLLLGSVMWREGRAFGPRDLERLALGRSTVPGAEQARLLAVCPSGVAEGVTPDVTLDAGGLLAAWRNP